MEAYVNVANTTPAPMAVVFRLAFSNGRTRSEKTTIPVGESWGAKVRSLYGSQASDPTNNLTSLVVTCNNGAVACPVMVTMQVAPSCEVVP